jgi:hypothetical protein
MIFRQCVSGDQRTPAHIADKAYTLLAMKGGAHQRMNPIAADYDIEEFALAPADLDDRTILDRLDCNAACVQADVGASQCASQNVEQIGTVNLKPSGTETLGHDTLRLGAKQNLPGRHVARQHKTGFETLLAYGILESDHAQDFGRIGCKLNTGADFFQLVSLFACSKTTGSNPHWRNAMAAASPPIPPPINAMRGFAAMPSR